MKTLSLAARSTALLLLAATLNLVFSPAAQAFTTSPKQLPAGSLVVQNAQDLVTQGCVASMPTPDGSLNVPDDKPVYAIAKDQPVGTYFFCPTTIVTPTASNTVTTPLAAGQKAPQVKGILGIGGVILAGLIGAALILPFQDALIRLFFKIVLVVLNGIAILLYWILIIASYLAGTMLVKSNFTTNNVFVERGWPIFVGLANISFLLILLYIALLIVLQADGGKGLKRMVPKLLFAALMVNSSLIVTGTIIDASRIVMALTLKTFNGLTVDVAVQKIGANLLRNSPIFTTAYTESSIKVGQIGNQFIIPIISSNALFDQKLLGKQCSDGQDNDGDRLFDQKDPDCHLDGQVDPNDEYKYYNPYDNTEGFQSCNDGRDNNPDENPAVDRNDPACITRNNQWNMEATESGPGPAPDIRIDQVNSAQNKSVNIGDVILAFGATFMIGVLVIGLVMLAFGLFKRFIMLTLLAMTSAVPWLGLAFPNTLGFTKQWWEQFLKYVMYGPLAVLGLALVASLPVFSIDIPLGLDPQAWIIIIINIATAMAILIGVNMAAQKIGGFSASQTLGMLKTAGQKIRQNPRLSGAIAGGLLMGPLGAIGGMLAPSAGNIAKEKATRFGYNVRDFGKEIMKPVRKQLKTGEFSEYDKDGKLKPGKDNWGKSRGKSIANRLGGTLYGNDPLNPEARAVMAASAVATDPAYGRERLSRKSVAGVLTKEQLRMLVDQGDHQQKIILLNNSDVVRKMDEDTRQFVFDRAMLPVGAVGPNGTPVTAAEHKQFQEASKALLRSLTAIDKQDDAAK